MLLKDFYPLKYSIVESDTPGPLRVRGVFQRADEKNANGRIYPRSLWEKLLSNNSLRENLSSRGMVGEIDHPSNSELKLKEAAVVVTDLGLNENGEVTGELEVLPTPQGQVLESLFKSGVRVGVSSRGEGTVVNKDGTDYISEDFQLYTFDVVANPSTRGAFPQVVRESVETREDKESSMGAKDKFESLKEQARRITSLQTSEISEAHREQADAGIDSLVESLDRIAAEDPGYATLAHDLAGSLLETRKKIRSAVVVESKLEAAAKILDGVKGKYLGLKAEAQEAVDVLLKENQRLKQENQELRAAYGLAIQEGEKVLREKQEYMKKYALATEAGEHLFQTLKKQPAAAPTQEGRRPNPGVRPVTEARVREAAPSPKKVAVRSTEAAPSTPSPINEAANMASTLLRKLNLSN